MHAQHLVNPAHKLFVVTLKRRGMKLVMTDQMTALDVHQVVLEWQLVGLATILKVAILHVCQFVETEESFLLKLVTMDLQVIILLI